MIEKMIAGVVPILLQRVATVPLADKQAFAGFLALLLDSYQRGDRAGFAVLVDKTTFSPEMKMAINQAVWGNGDQTRGSGTSGGQNRQR